MDTKERSWAKSITWRIVGIVILGAISYAFTHDWGKTTSITIIFHTIRLILYYFHERLWEAVSWGRIKHPLAHLSLRANLTRQDVTEIERLLFEQDYIARAPEYEI